MLNLFGWQSAKTRRLEKQLEGLRQQISRASTGKPSNPSDDQTDIVRAINSLKTEYEAQGKDQSAQNARNYRLNRNTFAAVFIYTLITLGIFKVGLDANTMSAASGRAWLSPVVISFNGVLSATISPNVIVQIQNFGKEPALGTTTGATAWTIPAPPEIQVDHAADLIAGKISNYPQIDWVNWASWFDITQLKRENLCQGVFPSEDGQVVYPSNATATVSITADGSHVDMSAVVNRKSIMVVTGCLVYRTLNETKASAFCYYLEPVEAAVPDGWTFHNCPVGNAAI